MLHTTDYSAEAVRAPPKGRLGTTNKLTTTSGSAFLTPSLLTPWPPLHCMERGSGDANARDSVERVRQIPPGATLASSEGIARGDKAPRLASRSYTRATHPEKRIVAIFSLCSLRLCSDIYQIRKTQKKRDTPAFSLDKSNHTAPSIFLISRSEPPFTPFPVFL